MENSCINHPDRKGTFFCQKSVDYFCHECACCHSPRVYCQFRTACVINMLTKEGSLGPCGRHRDRELGKNDDRG